MPKKAPKMPVVKEEKLEAVQEPVHSTPATEKPKRARSAWLNYYSHYYAHNKPKEGKIKVTEICREAASKWGGLTDEQKAKWKNPPANLG